MQIVCSVPDGINAYLENPNCLVTDATRRCPFCKDSHSLHRHAKYSRYLELPGRAHAVTVTILRLICPRTGATVSLLPDFCLPRRQIGPAILGLFLQALVTTSQAIGGALASAMGHPVARTTAQYLLKGFLRRVPQVRAYLSSRHPRTVSTKRQRRHPRPRCYSKCERNRRGLGQHAQVHGRGDGGAIEKSGKCDDARSRPRAA